MNEKSPEKDSPPPSPPPKPSSTTSSPNHTRDASLQQILRQFDPLSPERQAKKEPPLPPPKDVSAPSSPDVTLPPPAVPEKENRNSFNMTRRSSILSVERPPPAEPDQPFEFQRFLDQMRHKSADAVARYMKSFLLEFNKRSWTVSEQQKIVHDFLNFISNKIPLYEPWASATPNELSNALEGMEKLVMNRLYSRTFAPAALASLESNESYFSSSSSRVPEKEAREKLGDLMDDIERDRVLAERIEIFDWVGPKELDIPEGMVEHGERFLGLAEQELLKINNYRAPRDKVICILNSSKVLFGLIRQSHLVNKDTSADSFLPLLILLLLRSNPPHLYSNIQYIQRFRSPERLSGEGGYYLNSLEAAVGWIESIEKGVLSCSEEDFDKNVEAAVARIAERHRLEAEAHEMEEQAAALSSSPKRSSTPQVLLDRASRLMVPATDRERGEVLGPTRDLLVSGSGRVMGAVQKQVKGIGSLVFGEGESPPDRPDSRPVEEQAREREEEAAVRLANAEIQRAELAEREHRGETLEMLCQMFPDLDREVVEAVIVAKDGRVGVCIDVCLELSGGIETQEGSPENRPEDENSGQKDDGTKEDTADLIGLEGENGISSLDLEGNRGQEVTDVTVRAKVDLMD